MATYFINQKALKDLGNLVDEEEEDFYSNFRDMLVNDMTKYAITVRDFELKLDNAKKSGDANYYREEYARLDNSRKRLHDSVISNLEVANRINKSEGLDPVFDVGEDRSVHDVHRTDITDAVLSWLAENNCKDTDAPVKNKLEKNVDVANNYNYSVKLNTFPLVKGKDKKYEFRSLWTGEVAEPSQVEKYIKSQLDDYSEKAQDKIKEAFKAALELQGGDKEKDKDKKVEGPEI